jgi:hypothetical protein
MNPEQYDPLNVPMFGSSRVENIFVISAKDFARFAPSAAGTLVSY